MKELGAAVVGAGKMGFLHAGIFNSLDESRLVAICEKNKTIVGALRQNFKQIQIFTDYKEMLDKAKVDIAVINTPVHLHKMMIEAALDKNIHVFVEKPLALNGAECNSILAKKHTSRTMVGYCRRFIGTYKLAKKIIEERQLGELKSFKSQFYAGSVLRKAKGWRYDPETSGGGVMMDLGCHAVDMLHFLFGDIDEVKATSKSYFHPDVEDLVSVDTKFRSGLKGPLEVSWSIKEYTRPEFKVSAEFDSGSLVVTEKYIEVVSNADKGNLKKGRNVFYKQQLSEIVPINIGGPEYTAEDRHLARCILEGRETSCNLVEGAKTNFTIDSVYNSIKSNRAEKVRYGSE